MQMLDKKDFQKKLKPALSHRFINRMTFEDLEVSETRLLALFLIIVEIILSRTAALAILCIIILTLIISIQ